MDIRIERDVIVEAVAWAARTLPTRPSIPILAGLLITTTDDGITMSTFDYETSAQVSVPATVIEEGQVLVSGRLLAEICRNLPLSAVQMRTTPDESVILTCGHSAFKLQMLPVDEYPNLPEMPTTSGTVATTDFSKAISQVVIAAGTETAVPVITAVKLELSGNQLSMIATDRYRVGLRTMEWTQENDVDSYALVPARVLAEVARSMSLGETITIALSTLDPQQQSRDIFSGTIGFSCTGPAGTRQLTTRLISGDYPDINSVFRNTYTMTVRCSTDALISSVKRVSLVVGRNEPLRITFEQGRIGLHGVTANQAQGFEWVDASVENLVESGEGFAMEAAGIDPRFLSDALSVINTPFVQFSFIQQGKPCLIEGIESDQSQPDPSYRHAIMLMRLPSYDAISHGEFSV